MLLCSQCKANNGPQNDKRNEKMKPYVTPEAILRRIINTLDTLRNEESVMAAFTNAELRTRKGKAVAMESSKRLGEAERAFGDALREARQYLADTGVMPAEPDQGFPTGTIVRYAHPTSEVEASLRFNVYRAPEKGRLDIQLRNPELTIPPIETVDVEDIVKA